VHENRGVGEAGGYQARDRDRAAGVRSGFGL